jgi:hypothetical protein
MTNGCTDSSGSSRRQLLRILALAGSTAAATTMTPGAAFANRTQKQKGVVVYRLSVRKTSRCKACARHHKRFTFLTHALANARRAHPGCNCPINTQFLFPRTFRLLFAKGGSGVGDLSLLAERRRA